MQVRGRRCRRDPACSPWQLHGQGVHHERAIWRVERVMYRLIGAQPDDQQRWTKYLSSLLAFSAVSVLFLYALLLCK